MANGHLLGIGDSETIIRLMNRFTVVISLSYLDHKRLLQMLRRNIDELNYHTLNPKLKFMKIRDG